MLCFSFVLFILMKMQWGDKRSEKQEVAAYFQCRRVWVIMAKVKEYLDFIICNFENIL